MKYSVMKYAQVELIAWSTTAGLFADMINQSNRGPNFSWEKFADMAERWTIIQCKLNGTKDTKYIEVAKQCANNIASLLIERSGLTEDRTQEH